MARTTMQAMGTVRCPFCVRCAGAEKSCNTCQGVGVLFLPDLSVDPRVTRTGTTSTNATKRPHRAEMGEKEQADNIQDRLATAQWVLERHLAWIAAAEVKVGVIVTIDTALLGGLATAFGASTAPARTACAFFFLLLAGCAIVLGLYCAAMAVLPRTNGPHRSLLFFVPIAAQDSKTYGTNFKNATDEELLKDWTDQIHRNAEISRDKYVWVRRSMIFSFVTSIPWIVAICMLVK